MHMKNRYLFLLLLMAAALSHHAQMSVPTPAPDTSALLQAFKRGKATGQIRSVFMATDNAPGYKDDHAWAIGGVFRYETAPFHRFSLAAAGACSMRLLSSDIGTSDSLTGQLVCLFQGAAETTFYVVALYFGAVQVKDSR